MLSLIDLFVSNILFEQFSCALLYFDETYEIIKNSQSYNPPVANN